MGDRINPVPHAVSLLDAFPAADEHQRHEPRRKEAVRHDAWHGIQPCREDGWVEVTFEAGRRRVQASGGRPVASADRRMASATSTAGPRLPAPAFACAIPSGA